MNRCYYYIMLGLTVAVLTGLFLYNKHAEIKSAAIAEFKSSNAQRIQKLAEGFIKPEDFSSGSEQARENFKNFWDAVNSPEITRLKVWDKNSTVLWSNLSEIIGQSFDKNHEVKEALEGEVEFEEVSQTANEKGEYFFERQYVELGELYVPFANSDGKIVGVLEVYQSLIMLNQKIKQDFWQAAFYAIATAFALSAAGIFALRFYFKNLLHK